MLKTKTLLISIVSSIIILISCNDDGSSENNHKIQHLREAQLENVYINEIMPLNNTFVLATQKLYEEIKSFKTTTTLEHLIIAQKQWKEVLKVWKKIELYDIGNVKNSFIHFEINRWPTDTSQIETIIDGTEPIDEASIIKKGSSSKGIAALEYLLFSSKEKEETLALFTTKPNFNRRLLYLESLSQNLQSQATVLQSIWESYRSGFMSSLEDGISGTQNQIINAMIALTEEIIISKLGKPMGDATNGTINIKALEAYRSNTSLLIIREHLNALQRCYTGEFVEKTATWGFDNYLQGIERIELDKKIKKAFDECQKKTQMASENLENILINDPEYVKSLKNTFSELLVLLKVDMANAIGSTITINDNDGD